MPLKRLPTTLQIEATECGAAALHMVLAGFGRHVPLEELRDRFGAARDGVDAATLVRVAEAEGLKARALSCERETLRALPLPQILFWNFDHFVVLAGWSRRTFLIKDPARGEVELSDTEVDRCFTGISLVFEPGPSFVPGGRSAGLLTPLLSNARGAWHAIAAVLAIGLLQAAAAVLLPGFARVFVDDYLGRGFGDWLLPLLGGMAAVLVFRTLLAWLRANVVQRLQTKLAVALSARFLWHLFHLPFGFFANRSPGELSARAQFAGQVAGAIANPLVQIGVSLLSLAVYGAAMFLFSMPLAGLAVAFAGLNLLAMRWLSRRVRDSSLLVQAMAGRAHAANIQAAALMEDYKAAGADNTLFGRLMDVEIDHINAEQRSGRLQKLIAVSPILSAGLLDVIVLGAGAWQVLAGSLTVGGLIGFQMLAGLFSGPLSSLLGLGGALQMTAGPMARLEDVLAYRRDPDCGGKATPVPLSGKVEVRSLSYSYAGGPPVLVDVSFDLAVGSMTALTGPSGSGKSTLGRLLVGLMRPSVGELRLDGSIAYVDQQQFLFAGKIRDNIALWDQSLDAPAIAGAARGAAIDEVIGRRPGAYDGRIGEGGQGLSGGERQRLAIARALAVDPDLLVLDEATSALDTLSEAAVLDELRRRNVTTVLITHRASVLGRCDTVLRLDAGRLVASVNAA